MQCSNRWYGNVALCKLQNWSIRFDLTWRTTFFDQSQSNILLSLLPVPGYIESIIGFRREIYLIYPLNTCIPIVYPNIAQKILTPGLVVTLYQSSETFRLTVTHFLSQDGEILPVL